MFQFSRKYGQIYEKHKRLFDEVEKLSWVKLCYKINLVYLTNSALSNIIDYLKPKTTVEEEKF